jgi:hypothetical protein
MQMQQRPDPVHARRLRPQEKNGIFGKKKN